MRPFSLCPQFLNIPAGCESRIAETGADGQCSPTLNVGHKGCLAGAPEHSIVMHNNGGIFAPDLGDRVVQRCRKMKVFASQFPGKFWRTAIYRAVFVNDTGAANSDERR